MTESTKIVIELFNLSDGGIRTMKRELKVLIEDYGLRKMVSECMRVTEVK